jgi:DnaJ-class molecular chaperone
MTTRAQMADTEDKTGVFHAVELNQQKCPDCLGTGELRIDSENINEHFEVEKQTVITPCSRCGGTGFIPAG